MFLAPAQHHTHSRQLFSVSHRKELYSSHPSPIVGPRTPTANSSPAPSVMLGSGPPKAATGDGRWWPQPPPLGHNVQKVLAGPGRHHPVLFSSCQTLLFLISQAASHSWEALSWSLFAFWLTAVLWLLLGTPPTSLAWELDIWDNGQ